MNKEYWETKKSAQGALGFIILMEMLLPFLKGPGFWAMHILFLLMFYSASYTIGRWNGFEEKK